MRVARNVETSVAFLPFVFTAVAFGRLAASLVGACADALDFRRPYLRWAIYVPARGLAGAFTGLLAASVIGPHSIVRGATLATVVAGFVSVIFDALFNAGTFSCGDLPLSAPTFARSGL